MPEDKNWSARISRFIPFLKNRGEGELLSAGNDPIVGAFVQDQIKNPASFNSAICTQDEMYLFALRSNGGNRDRASIEVLATGKQSLNVVRSIVDWKFGGFGNLTRFLDFASGYGRLTRFLVRELRPDNIWVCDIYEEAVRFQVKQFGVHGLVSVTDPRDYRDTHRYDCIFVASLFSHLPEETFLGWLRKLYELLTPSGVLIFSVHDVAVLPSHLEHDRRGIVFLAESESRSLDKNVYGTTYVDESFVRNAIGQVTGREEYHRAKRGLWSFQDIYVISRNEGADYTGLDISQGPSGYLDVCRLTERGDVHFEGWAADFSRKGVIRNVQLLINGSLMLKCEPANARPDVEEAFRDIKGLRSGFSFDLDKDIVNPRDVILVKAVNADGLEHVLRAGRIDSIMDE